MKKVSFYIVFFYPLMSITLQAQTDFSVPLTFSVTQTGINRFIADQWNDATFTKSWSGTYNGLSYSIALNKPYIVLTENTIKINLGLTINATEGATTIYNGILTISPTLSIPPTTLSLGNIISKYSDLRQTIDAITQFTDVRLRDVVEQSLGPIDWIIHKGKALEASTTRIVETADMRLKGVPELIFSISSGQIDFTIQSVIQTSPPTYSFKWNRPSTSSFGLKVFSNNKISIEAIKIYNGESEFFVEPYSPTESAYDTSLGKYVASTTFNAPYAPGGIAFLSYKVKLRRQGSETSWRLRIGPSSGAEPTWYLPSEGVQTLYGE